MSRARARTKERKARRRAGFTLVELMVALTISAIVIATIFTLVGASARSFHEQQRVGQTQLSTRLGLDRLRRDIERAGLHGTPDSRQERNGGIAPSRVLSAVQLTDNDPASRAALTAIPAISANTVQADRLVLTGNYQTSDSYLVRGFDGAGSSAQLQVTWQAFLRSFGDFNDTTPPIALDANLFREVFAPGRLVHITTVAGNHFFVTVTGSSLIGAGPTAQASVQFTPPLPIGGLAVGGLAEGAMIAPLSQVEYALQTPPPDIGAIGDLAVTGPNTALVRTELNLGGGAPLSERTILEWAIHFDVDAIVDTAAIGGAPALQFFDDGAAQARVAAAPGRTRALVVEIGARTAEQDARLPWVAPAPGAGLSMFRVFTDRPGAARVRTGRLEVSLPNLAIRGM